MNNFTWLRSTRKAMMVIATLVLGSNIVQSYGRASASFPGENGRIASTIGNHGGFAQGRQGQPEAATRNKGLRFAPCI